MTKLKRKSIIFITIAFLVGVGFLLPFYPVSAYPTYPQTGIIAMWTGPIIPTGWEVVASTNSRFVMGTNTGETPGGLGGSSTHRHAYTQIPIMGMDIQVRLLLPIVIRIQEEDLPRIKALLVLTYDFNPNYRICNWRFNISSYTFSIYYGFFDMLFWGFHFIPPYQTVTLLRKRQP